MKIALMGGTFNPIHNGHLRLAEKVKNVFKYDKIIFIPSYLPAHKEISGSISANERLYMLKIALNGYEWAELSDCEIKRKGISYTVDTIDYMHENYNLSENPGLIIGDDLAISFNTWKDPDIISSKANLIVAHRLYEKEIPLNYKHRYIDNEIFKLSSSQIRELVSKGEDISNIVPANVSEYINQKGFYLGETL